MITLKETTDSAKIEELYFKAGLDQNVDSKCLLAHNGDEILGFCLFDLDDKKMVIRYIEPLNDIGLADGILRSTLHIAAERFVMDTFYSDTLSEEFLEKIQFIKDKTQKRLDIDKLFKSCCSCGG